MKMKYKFYYVLLSFLVGCNLNLSSPGKSSDKSNDGVSSTNEAPEQNQEIQKFYDLIAKDEDSLNNQDKKDLSDYNVKYLIENKKIFSNFFEKAELENQDLSNIDFSDKPNFSDRSKPNYISGTTYTYKNPNFARANLKNTNFTGTKLNMAKFIESSIKNTNFTKAELNDSIFIDSLRLAGATFDRASMENLQYFSKLLTDTSFKETILENAKFDSVIMSNLSFVNANLSGAEIKVASLINCDFTNADLSNVKFIINSETGKTSNNIFTGAKVGNVKFILNKKIDKDAFKVSLTSQGLDLTTVKLEEYVTSATPD